MKYILLTIALFLAVPAGAEQVKDGFKGYKWGTNINDFDSTFEFIEHDNKEIAGTGMSFYKVNIDSLAGIKLDDCIFFFLEDEFCSVVIFFSGYANHDKMLVTLKKVYGEPKKENLYIEEYSFNSGKSFRTYEYNQFKESGNLNLYSIKHFTEWNKVREQEAEKAAEDF